jgi:hemerythrin-like metal-binding protein
MAIHFADEEHLISDYMIPNGSAQILSHKEFLEKLDTVRQMVIENGVARGSYSQISRMLIQWITVHVNQEDYATFRAGEWRAHAFETMPIGKIFPLLRRTGNKTVDSQHQSFIAKAVPFCDEIDSINFSDPDRAAKALADFDDLIQYAVNHFSDEESFFTDNQRSASPRHYIEHANLTEALTNYRARFADGLISSSQAVRSVSLGWWLTHTNGTDIDTFGSIAFDTDLLEAPNE